jgi:transcriptional regulator with XRE-family HTH domain
MEPVQQWSGHTACELQRALRMSNESFAAHLGIAGRTVTMWHQKPERVPNSEMQQALDTALERTSDGAKARFALALDKSHGSAPETTDPTSGVPCPAVEDETAATGSLASAPSSVADSREATETADGDFMGWLQVAYEATAPPDGSDVGQILRWYRRHKRLTQHEVASLLSTTQSRLSKLEKGTQALRDVTELRYIARKLGIPPERLGVLPDHSRDASPFPSLVSDRPGDIRDSQENWRNIRRELNANRVVLAELAAELYPQQPRAPGSTILTSAHWMPDTLVDLADITLAWRPNPLAPRLDGRGTLSAGAVNIQPVLGMLDRRAARTGPGARV